MPPKAKNDEKLPAKFTPGIDLDDLNPAITRTLYRKYKTLLRKAHIDLKDCVSQKKFAQVMSRITDMEFSQERLDKLYTDCDRNKDGTVTYKELLVAMTGYISLGVEQSLREYIDILDTDKDGCIGRDELRAVFKSSSTLDCCKKREDGASPGARGNRCPGTLTTDEAVKKFFDVIDINNDGKITVAELFKAMTRDETIFAIPKICD